MNTLPVFHLKTSQSGCGSIRCIGNSIALAVEYEGSDHVGTLRFDGVVAWRFTAESHATDVPEGSWDQVVIICDSSWVESLRQDRTLISEGPLQHYAVYLSSNGLLEALAIRVRVDEDKQALTMPQL